jgi:lipoate---protein ligase
MGTAWRVDQRTGDAATLHAGWPTVDDDPEVPAVALCTVPAPAVVLGSTQSDQIVDPVRSSEAGMAVARRRSGGGAVLVTPDEPVWIDAWVPAAHPLWNRDVGRAFDWLGESWVRALASVGVGGLHAHRQGYVSCTQWSSLVCFGGVGTGEVVTADGRKVVGLAQRRDRRGTWFHGACVLSWDPSPLVNVLSLPADERDAAVEGLSVAVVGASDLARERVGADEVSTAGPVDRESVAAALIDALPTC